MKRGPIALILLLFFVLTVATSYALITNCISTGSCIVDTGGGDKLSPIDVFGYAGVLVTVLAFVAAFAIVLMTIDALAVSTTVKNNSEQVNKNLEKLESLKQGLSDATAKLGNIQKYLRVLESFSDELNRSSELDDDIYFVLEVIHGKIDLGDKIKSKILESRQLSRHRRTRLNALREVSLHLAGQSSAQGISQVYPELIAAYRSGDKNTGEILSLLKEYGLLSRSQERTFEGTAKRIKGAMA